MRLGYTSTDTFQYFTLSCSECIWCNRVLLGVRRRDNLFICFFVFSLTVYFSVRHVAQTCIVFVMTNGWDLDLFGKQVQLDLQADWM